MAKVLISILNWNGQADTTRCLESVLASTFTDYTVVVLDNGSQQNELTDLQARFHDKPNLHFFRSESNLGFAGGHNYIVEQLTNAWDYDYVLLLNQDAWLEPACLGYLVQCLENHHSIGAVSPLILAGATTTVQSVGVQLQRSTGKVINRWYGYDQTTVPLGMQIVSGIHGSCALLRRRVIQELGLFDPTWFAYYEEMDWSQRCWQADYKCVALGRAVAHHAPQHSFRTFWNVRNLIWFQKRWAKGLNWVLFLCYFPVFFVERLKKGSPLRELVKASLHGWML